MGTQDTIWTDDVKTLVKYGIGLLIFLIFIMVNACQKDGSYKYTEADSKAKSQAIMDSLVKTYQLGNDYSIILNDMEHVESNFKFFHKYQLLKVMSQPDTVLEYNTSWVEVDEIFFDDNIENIDMAIWSSDDGKKDTVASPAGYNRFYGNPHYGYWHTNSMWMFHTRYMYLNSMLHSYDRPITQKSWNTYNNNYRNRSAYYGSKKEYGTSSKFASRKNSNRSWYKKNQGTRSKIRSTVKQNANEIKSSGKRSSFGGSRARISRTKSSFRSRGGGFGK